MSESGHRRLSDDELLSEIVDDVAALEVHQQKVLEIIAELDRRGAAAELGHQDLGELLRHVLGFDPRTPGPSSPWPVASARPDAAT